MASLATRTKRSTGHDLLIVTDATASMGSYLKALNCSIPEIIRISAITGCFDSIGVIAYRDYCGGKVIDWSGWYGQKAEITHDKLISFCVLQMARYGGDWAEATKTGLSKAYDIMNQDTIVILYADAPPHMPVTGGVNRKTEAKTLSNNKFTDWVSACAAMAEKSRVYSLIKSRHVGAIGPYMYLSHQTGGTCFELASKVNSETISELTISILLAWMGVGKPGLISTHIVATVKTYINTSIAVKDEADPNAENYWVHFDAAKVENTRANIADKHITLTGLVGVVEPRKEPMQDFSERYKCDPEYRLLVVTTLEDIIAKDITAMTLNPIFGTLWRTVCGDRLNETRDALITSFGYEVQKLKSPEEKETMNKWLAESYDYKGDILAMLAEVDESDKYPCVFLDPTLDFGGGGDAEDDEGGNIYKFKREELLEIGRSCDFRVLRRLGKVLTQLTYVNNADELPAHVKDIPDDQCPKLPLALAQGKYKREFWKIILHLLLEGTMLSSRPAALLAALSIKMGIAPLREIAYSEMLSYKSKWNNLEIPETWNSNCLSLILDADVDYRRRNVSDDVTGLLSESDRLLFDRLVDYKMLEHNLKTTLTARIGWHPEKVKSAIGPTVVCRICKHPRSVTIMAARGICGFCQYNSEEGNAPLDAEYMSTNISTTEGSWVECVMSDCRSQYIVYNTSKLNVRAKCFYCRSTTTKPTTVTTKATTKATTKTTNPSAPSVECTKCQSRMIWPIEYRSKNLDLSQWKCPCCLAGNTTIINHETTAETLSHENGISWLLTNTNNLISHPLDGTSLYKTISNLNISDFPQKVLILPSLLLLAPPATQTVHLVIKGKPIQNPLSILTCLSGWIRRRKTDISPCSLCFNPLATRNVGGGSSACGRKGCRQLICTTCCAGWFGINKPGRIINVSALSCPFCRRLPAAKTVRRFGVHAVPGLEEAVRRAGETVFAWCVGCGHARGVMGRRVCGEGRGEDGRGGQEELVDWSCEDCRFLDIGGDGRAVAIPCPGCNTLTQKMGGCDHITCPVEGCGMDWCWSCGFVAEDADMIYAHMMRVHGGIYGGRDE